MRKLISYGLLSLGALMLFSGCGAKKLAVCEYRNGGTKDSRSFFVQGYESWQSPSYGYNVKTRNTHLLQNSAALTLHYGYKYFAFVRVPSPKINNASGSLVHTAKGFLDLCAPTSFNIVSYGNSPCGYNPDDADAKAMITIFKKQPYDMTTYDAQEVKDYLVKNKLWRKDGIDEYKASCGI